MIQVLRSRVRQLMLEKSARDGRRITLRDVQAATGLAYATVQNLAANRGVQNVRLSTIEALCEYFDCRIEDVIERV